MGPTPLYDALCGFAAQSPLRMHMPGHKGRTIPLPVPLSAALDFTELPPTGDLFFGGGAIEEAETLWSQTFHMDHALFLTGGSTQGMLSALTLAAPPGSTVLLDRSSHRSAYNALALLDLTPVYLSRPWLDRPGILGPISPQSVDHLLKTHPEIKTVCIVSPTYYGVLSDIPAISAVVHAHGGKLVVDAAHGAHLPFLGDRTLSAADLAVVSAHKTLPALGQSAVLLSGNAFSHGAVRHAASLYGSSSPSYLLMASLDTARAWMETEGIAHCRRVAEETARLRARFPSVRVEDAPLDPLRFTLCCCDGFSLQQELEAQGVYPEMADARHVVFILSPMDVPESLAHLAHVLDEVVPPTAIAPSPLPFCPPPDPVGSPRAARLGPVVSLPLEAAEGRVCACQVAPYPPGIPVLAPGERIGKKHLAYLCGIGYNMKEDIQVVP